MALTAPKCEKFTPFHLFSCPPWKNHPKICILLGKTLSLSHGAYQTDKTGKAGAASVAR